MDALLVALVLAWPLSVGTVGNALGAETVTDKAPVVHVVGNATPNPYNKAVKLCTKDPVRSWVCPN